MASKYLQKYPVPQGFPDVLHDFAREVLRDQPENIYEFGFLYFKAMEEVGTYSYDNRFVQGKPFEYQHKGKAIPPPKDRQPTHQDYTYIQPGAVSSCSL